MSLLFLPEARLKFEEAENYYHLQLPGLEHQYREEVRNALRRLHNWPLAFPVEQDDILRVLLTRFLYKLLYSLETDHLNIIAVAHQHRRPNYLIGRAEVPQRSWKKRSKRWIPAFYRHDDGLRATAQKPPQPNFSPKGEKGQGCGCDAVVTCDKPDSVHERPRPSRRHFRVWCLLEYRGLS